MEFTVASFTGVLYIKEMCSTEFEHLYTQANAIRQKHPSVRFELGYTHHGGKRVCVLAMGVRWHSQIVSAGRHRAVLTGMVMGKSIHYSPIKKDVMKELVQIRDALGLIVEPIGPQVWMKTAWTN